MEQGVKTTAGQKKRKPFVLKPRQFTRHRRPTDGIFQEEMPRRTFPRIFNSLSPLTRLAAREKKPEAKPSGAAVVPARRLTLIDIMKSRRDQGTLDPVL